MVGKVLRKKVLFLTILNTKYLVVSIKWCTFASRLRGIVTDVVDTL